VRSDIEALADRLVALRFEHEPLEGAMLGIDDQSSGLADLARATEDGLIDAYHEIARAADELSRSSFQGAALEEREILTLDVLSHAASATADELATRLVELTVSSFPNCPAVGLFSLLPQLPVDTPERREMYLDRLGEIPRFLTQLGERHLEGVDGGRTPTRRGVANAVGFVRRVVNDAAHGGLRRDESDERFLEVQEQLLRDEVTPALAKYGSLLEERVLDHARDDQRPGLCALDQGEEIYEVMTRVSTSTARTPAELHRTGLSIIDDLGEAFVDVGSRLWGLDNVTAVHDRLRHDPLLRYGDDQEMLTAARDAVRRAEAAAPRWFGVVPTTACAVEPVPAALADAAAPAYYHPGALDGSRPGTYFINTSRPDESFRQLAEAIAFHEAVPGHHFQLTISQQTPGSHLVQSVFADEAHVEGWGLYAERLAHEMGLYSDDLAVMGMLSTEALRAARLILDTGIHAFGWTRAEAVDWMGRHVPISPPEIVAEVDRYISMPGQALSYMVGRLELHGLRDEAQRRLGGGFDLREFHDVVLASGPVSLRALGGAVRRWINAHPSHQVTTDSSGR
jgi:uncharacterized protein (DUF885 family)